jgi:triacylglycerol lipase
VSQTPEIRAAIAAFGSEIGPASLEGVQALYDAEQRALAQRVSAAASDIPYGDHSRQRLDVYVPAGATGHAPVFVWVHGGGFLRGDKGNAERWPNANSGRFAASEGFLGVVMNYRLAPDHPWPAGGEDVGSVVDWAKANAAQFGGDPKRVVLVGTSAGAVHVATHIQLRPDSPVRGAVLLSALYGIEPYTDVRDLAYYGEDASRHAGRAPLSAIVDTDVPLLIACSEFDPPRFQAETIGLLQRRLVRHGRLPRSFIGTGHNHYSFAYHLGTSDRRLGDEIAAFVRDVCAPD